MSQLLAADVDTQPRFHEALVEIAFLRQRIGLRRRRSVLELQFGLDRLPKPLGNLPAELVQSRQWTSPFAFNPP